MEPPVARRRIEHSNCEIWLTYFSTSSPFLSNTTPTSSEDIVCVDGESLGSKDAGGTRRRRPPGPCTAQVLPRCNAQCTQHQHPWVRIRSQMQKGETPTFTLEASLLLSLAYTDRSEVQ